VKVFDRNESKHCRTTAALDAYTYRWTWGSCLPLWPRGSSVPSRSLQT